MRRNYAVYTLAVHRRDTNIEQQISRFSFGEYQAFKKLAVQFYKDIETNKGKVPVFEYTNTHEVIELKALNINVPLFKFLGWKDRPADFVVPVWESQ